MIKKIDRSLEIGPLKIGAVYLTAETLVEYLSEIALKAEVTGENGDYAFESLDDLRTNKELLVGRPEVEISFKDEEDWRNGSARLTFNTNTLSPVPSATIRAYNLKSGTQVGELQKLQTKIASHKSPLDYLRRTEDVLFYLMMGAFVAVFISLMLAPIIPNSDTITFVLLSIVICLFGIGVIKRVWAKNFVPVRTSISPGVWSRIKDNVYSHLAVAVGALFIGWVALKIGIAS